MEKKQVEELDPVPPVPQLEIGRSAEHTSPQNPSVESHLIFGYLKRPKPTPSRTRARWIVISLYVIMTLAGWDTGSSAPLLPFLQEYYKSADMPINYVVMSMIFVTMFVGTVIAASLNVYLTDRLGFGLVAALGTVSYIIGFAISSSGCPYPLFAFSFAFNGIGFGFQDAQINTITARLPNPTARMSLLHAFFGLGGTVAPFISTPFVQHYSRRPYLLYTINLAVAVLTLAVEAIVFRGQTEEQLVGKTGTSTENGQPVILPLGEIVPPEAAEEGGQGVEEPSQSPRGLESSGHKMRRIMTTPVVYVFMLYSLLYVGFETTLGSWAPTYLINARGADANAGYVTSGFWGGLTVGRVVLIPITKRLGNRTSTFVYSAVALALTLVVWLVPNYICSAICICFIGFFLAPIFPSAVVLITETVPEELHTGVIGLFGTIGGAGAAAMPFVLAAIADEFGFWVMGPFMTATIAASIVLWCFVPRQKV